MVGGSHKNGEIVAYANSESHCAMQLRIPPVPKPEKPPSHFEPKGL